VTEPAPSYKPAFYDVVTEAAEHAARRVVPVILQAVRPASVIDVGCGAGAWTRAFLDAGVEDVTGVDGEWVDEKRLLIPPGRFLRVGLDQPFRLPRQFDLCLCLETAEHLPESRADGFVTDLVALSDVVVFSAAVPFQGGTHHLNERWQRYWVARFAAHGYVGVDYLRRRIWNLERFNTWFYAQNMLVFVKEGALPRYPELSAEYRYQAGEPLSLVHPGLLLLRLPWEKHLTVRTYFRLFPRMAARAVGAAFRRILRRPPAPPLGDIPPGAAGWHPPPGPRGSGAPAGGPTATTRGQS
jgi:SAM-dependent methyltransferase